MTPSETIEQHDPAAAPTLDLASLIEACGRDERPALKSLYEQTAAVLYGRAVAATSRRADADQALVQTYLSVFAEAEQFDAGTAEPRAWLEGILGRHLPVLPVGGRTASTSAAAVEPPAELWQKLDIGLGLQRLDRHIKPGIATQARGRDPMPNAYDRRIERQLRFWRVTGVASFSAFVLALGFLWAVALEGGPLNSLWNPLSSDAANLAGAPSDSHTDERAKLAILRAAEEGRVWRVDLAGDGLEVRSLPPFVANGDNGRPGALVLWAELTPELAASLAPAPAAGDEPAGTDSPAQGTAPALLRLADLDPAATTRIPVPDGLDPAELGEDGLGFVISLEPAGAPTAIEPVGPVLFSGRLAP